MIRTLPAALIAGLLLGLAACASQPASEEPARIVAVGDVHGDFEQYVRVLQMNGLVDERLNWTGGATRLVQLGDVPDRGPDTDRIIRHLMQLERQSRRAGGGVHVLIGNHEVMNIRGDLRYVHAGEYDALVTSRSEHLQQQYIRQLYAQLVQDRPELADEREQTLAMLAERFPLGYVEHRLLWEPGGEFARWVARNDAVLQIGRTLFVHGGINPHEPLRPLEEINRAVHEAILSDPREESYVDRPDSVLWYRGLALNDAETELEPLIEMLAYYGADRIVIAHTPTGGEIVTRFDGRVINIDVGLSDAYGGNLGNLLIEGDRLYAVTPAGRQPLDAAIAESDPIAR
jgi:hypothetical protein